MEGSWNIAFVKDISFYNDPDSLRAYTKISNVIFNLKILIRSGENTDRAYELAKWKDNFTTEFDRTN